MVTTRRNFLKKCTVISSGLVISNFSGNELFAETNSTKIKNFGIQLYSLKDDMPGNAKKTLKQLASFGYRLIESYEGSDGMFWGMKPKEFKSYLDSLNLQLISSHCDMNKDFEKKVDDAASIGMKYLICPSIGPQNSIDGYKRFAEEFNRKGEICKKSRIRFAYHNHDYTFKELNGQLPQDVLMQNTDASLVDYQLDIYWAATAGQDALAWVKKYPNRFKLFHIKDRIKNSAEMDASCNLGAGCIDYEKILKVLSKQSTNYFIVEQERFDGTSPIDSAMANARYLSCLGTKGKNK
jgi:sugar phosphate isomerase/epimerase